MVLWSYLQGTPCSCRGASLHLKSKSLLILPMTAESGLFAVLRGAPSREIQKILAIFPASREFGLAPRSAAGLALSAANLAYLSTRCPSECEAASGVADR